MRLKNVYLQQPGGNFEHLEKFAKSIPQPVRKIMRN